MRSKLTAAEKSELYLFYEDEIVKDDSYLHNQKLFLKEKTEELIQKGILVGRHSLDDLETIIYSHYTDEYFMLFI